MTRDKGRFSTRSRENFETVEGSAVGHEPSSTLDDSEGSTAVVKFGTPAG
jgi:hypothetical protein